MRTFGKALLWGRLTITVIASMLIGTVVLSGCAADSEIDGDEQLIVYSGRTSGLMKRIVDDFEEITGVDVKIIYEKPRFLMQKLRATHGDAADVFLSSDASSLARLRSEGLLARLPAPVRNKVPAQYRGAEGRWVGVTAWGQGLVYNSDMVQRVDVPTSFLELADPKWAGKVGINLNSRAFQATLIAMRERHGDEYTKNFLRDLKNNQIVVKGNSRSIIKEVNSGKLVIGLVNSYDWYQFHKHDRKALAKVKPVTFAANDIGQVMNASAVGVLQHAEHDADARHFVAFLLARISQQHFTNAIYEYPLSARTVPAPDLPAYSSLQPPEFNLDTLVDQPAMARLINEQFSS